MTLTYISAVGWSARVRFFHNALRSPHAPLADVIEHGFRFNAALRHWLPSGQRTGQSDEMGLSAQHRRLSGAELTRIPLRKGHLDRRPAAGALHEAVGWFGS
jgi:hypothetical protein